MTDTIQQLDLSTEISVGTKDVFSTMLMVELEDEEPFINQKCSIQSNLTSMLGLGGGVRGILAVHCPASVAKDITGAFLGMEVEEIDEDVIDAIGEIANMIAGNLKVSWAKDGIKVELATPTSVVGESFRISGISGATRHVVPFKMKNEMFWVELLYVFS